MPKNLLARKILALKSQLIVERKVVLDKQKEQRYRKYIILGLVLMSFLYIYQVNAMAAKGYEIQELEAKKAMLQKQNDELKMAVTEAKSSDNIVQRLEEMELVPVYNVSYIKTSNNGFAVVK